MHVTALLVASILRSNCGACSLLHSSTAQRAAHFQAEQCHATEPCRSVQASRGKRDAMHWWMAHHCHPLHCSTAGLAAHTEHLHAHQAHITRLWTRAIALLWHHMRACTQIDRSSKRRNMRTTLCWGMGVCVCAQRLSPMQQPCIASAHTGVGHGRRKAFFEWK